MSFKPSGEEEKWAKQQELDIRRKLKEFVNRQKESEIIDVGSVCPADGQKLEIVEIDGTGLTVHRCTYCGGIWINRNDLEKLLHSTEKSNKLVEFIGKIFNIKL